MLMCPVKLAMTRHRICSVKLAMTRHRICSVKLAMTRHRICSVKLAIKMGGGTDWNCVKVGTHKTKGDVLIITEDGDYFALRLDVTGGGEGQVMEPVTWADVMKWRADGLFAFEQETKEDTGTAFCWGSDGLMLKKVFDEEQKDYQAEKCAEMVKEALKNIKDEKNFNTAIRNLHKLMETPVRNSPNNC